MVQMLLAVEDQQFYDHWGINPRRIFIVAANNLLKMQIEAGASTITQQLARMLFLTRKQTYERKYKEALTSIKLERTHSKDEILEMYLNLYYFHRAYGISAASHAFFSKKALCNLEDGFPAFRAWKPFAHASLTIPDPKLRGKT